MSTNEIPLDDAQLTALMEELEAETGITTAVVAPPEKIKVVEASSLEDEVILIDEEAALLAEIEQQSTMPDLQPETESQMFTDAELDEIAQLELSKSEVKPKQTPQELQQALASMTGIGESLSEPEVIPAVSEEDLEAELAKMTQELETEAAAEVVVPAPTPEPEPTPVAAPAPESTPAHTGNGLKFFVDPHVFKQQTAVNEYNLDNCFMEQSSLRAYYGAMAARADAQASMSKAKFEVLEARLYDHHRKSLLADGTKATEKMVENAVKADPRWLKGKELVIDADTIAAVNKALSVSLADRRDMLIQLGADRRDESKGQARMMAIKAEQESTAERATAGASALRSGQ